MSGTRRVACSTSGFLSVGSHGSHQHRRHDYPARWLPPPPLQLLVTGGPIAAARQYHYRSPPHHCWQCPTTGSSTTSTMAVVTTRTPALVPHYRVVTSITSALAHHDGCHLTPSIPQRCRPGHHRRLCHKIC